MKLDELLRATRSARNTLVDLENMSDDELEELQEEFRRLREIAAEEVSGRARRRRERQVAEQTERLLRSRGP